MPTSYSFRVAGLPVAQFTPLFSLTDEQLAQRGAQRVIADEKPGFPCRVSLVDAEPGESLLLLSFIHQSGESPYRSSGPIFVREHARETDFNPGEVPELLRSRLLSVRGYDTDDMMVDAEVIEGDQLEREVDRLFGDRQIRYLHVHNARRGCFACRIDRAGV